MDNIELYLRHFVKILALCIWIFGKLWKISQNSLSRTLGAALWRHMQNLKFENVVVLGPLASSVVTG